MLPCTCWYELSTQTFGEEGRSLGLLVVVAQATGDVEEASAEQEPGVSFQGTDAAAVEQVLGAAWALVAELLDAVPKRFAAAGLLAEKALAAVAAVAQVVGAVSKQVGLVHVVVALTAAAAAWVLVVKRLVVALVHFVAVELAGLLVEVLAARGLLVLVAAQVLVVGLLGVVPKRLSVVLHASGPICASQLF